MIGNHQILSAPIQGYTDHVWRTAHAQVFGGVDAYYAPFMRVEHGQIRQRDLRDISPDSNHGLRLIPQILACRPIDMEQMIDAVASLGYNELDINLGCPHPPLARRGFGSGMLARPDDLKHLFKLLGQKHSLKFSLKIRLGWDVPDQWRVLVSLLKDSPVILIIVHFRIGTQQYKGDVMLNLIEDTIDTFHTPVIINGDITSSEQAHHLLKKHPDAAGVMIGRALVSNPALLCPSKASSRSYQMMHDLMYDRYRSILTGGEHQILTRMQSLWERLLPDADHRSRKAIKKATTLSRYESAVTQLFQSLDT